MDFYVLFFLKNKQNIMVRGMCVCVCVCVFIVLFCVGLLLLHKCKE